MASISVAGDTSGSITISAPLVAGSGTLTLPTGTDTLVGLAATQTLTNKTVTAPVLSGTITGTYTLGGTPTVTGTLTAGTPCVMSPAAVNTKSTQAHGLSGTPSMIIAYRECLTAELGYSIGDRIFSQHSGSVNQNFLVEYDGTNVVIIMDNILTGINKTTPAGNQTATPGSWKLVATPYKLN